MDYGDFFARLLPCVDCTHGDAIHDVDAQEARALYEDVTKDLKLQIRDMREDFRLIRDLTLDKEYYGPGQSPILAAKEIARKHTEPIQNSNDPVICGNCIRPIAEADRAKHGPGKCPTA